MSDAYLRQVLADQQLDDDSDELRVLRDRAEEVKDLLADAFAGCAYTIRYGGSKAKGTLIVESYDLDQVFYVHCDEDGAGENLAEIYDNVANALGEVFIVERKTCALRLHGRRDGSSNDDLKVDVVPGRFTDASKTDCYLHQSQGLKSRLKTNLQVHIDHVRGSGVLDAIRLLKLIRVRRHLAIKQCIWELLGIELLTGKKSLGLGDQLRHVLQRIRDLSSPPSVVDPANPTGNDFTSVVEDAWPQLQTMAVDVLALVDRRGWEGVFELPSARVNRLLAAAGDTRNSSPPWDKGGCGR